MNTPVFEEITDTYKVFVYDVTDIPVVKIHCECGYDLELYTKNFSYACPSCRKVYLFTMSVSVLEQIQDK